MIKNITDIVSLFILLAPIVIQLVKLLSQHVHSKKIQNLLDRATIIVSALERSDLNSQERRQKAINDLSQYATQAGIKMTGDQLAQYIESAVTTLHSISSTSDTLQMVQPLTPSNPIQTAQMVNDLGGDKNAQEEGK